MGGRRALAWSIAAVLGCVDYPVVSPVFGCDAGARCGDRCVDLTRDVANCGRCANACPTAAPGSRSWCEEGACRRACEPGRGDCDGDVRNGCETDVTLDVQHCGACGRACPGGAAATCAGGQCGVRCDGMRGDCDGTPNNGCEVDLRTNAMHCGTCHAACPSRANASVACIAGGCAAECRGGFGDCDRAPENGCEAEFASDPSHCGACGAVCPARANAVGQCVGGRCGILCADGFGDCDGEAANGCEVDLRSSAAHCGACDRACVARPSMTPSCTGGVCGGECLPWRGDCDGNVMNGCESDTSTDVRNCGACGSACVNQTNVAQTGCRGAACAIERCSPGHGNCDGNVSNGCETLLGRDPNCGGCLNDCGDAGRTCIADDASYVCR